MPTASVPARPGGAGALLKQPLDLGALRVRIAGRTLNWEEALAATATDGLVVILRGRIVHESYVHVDGGASQHILMSATKSLVGLLAGLLAATGRLDLDAVVSSIIPALRDTPFEGATIRQLLDMRTGVTLSAAQLAAYNQASGWEVAAAPDSDLRAFFRDLPRSAPAVHGGAFRYLSANTDLLGWVIESSTGSTLARLFSEHLWQPMGAESDAYFTLDRGGLARATGGLCATVRDLARVGLLLVDGQPDGRQIVPSSWITDTETAGDREAWRCGEFALSFGPVPMSYRNGWYVMHGASPLLFAMGIHGQNLFVDRRAQLIVAKVSSQAQPTDPLCMGITHRLMNELRRALA